MGVATYRLASSGWGDAKPEFACYCTGQWRANSIVGQLFDVLEQTATFGYVDKGMAGSNSQGQFNLLCSHQRHIDLCRVGVSVGCRTGVVKRTLLSGVGRDHRRVDRVSIRDRTKYGKLGFESLDLYVLPSIDAHGCGEDNDPFMADSLCASSPYPAGDPIGKTQRETIPTTCNPPNAYDVAR